MRGVVLSRVMTDMPALLADAQTALTALSGMSREGMKLDAATVANIGKAENRGIIWTRAALWIGALSLAVLAARQLGLV